MFQALLASVEAAGQVVVFGSLVRLAEHQVRFTAEQQARVDDLLADFERDPYNTPSFKLSAARIGDDLLAALIDQGRFVSVSPEVLFRAEDYAGMLQAVRAKVRAQGKITVAEVRDLFSTSRKYALALMEHLDAEGVTRRVGDERVLRA
jgi:selenocysteine-specific elongation factor